MVVIGCPAGFACGVPSAGLQRLEILERIGRHATGGEHAEHAPVVRDTGRAAFVLHTKATGLYPSDEGPGLWSRPSGNDPSREFSSAAAALQPPPWGAGYGFAQARVLEGRGPKAPRRTTGPFHCLQSFVHELVLN